MNRNSSGEKEEEMSAHGFDQLSPGEKVWALFLLAFVLGGKGLIDEELRKIGESLERHAGTPNDLTLDLCGESEE